MDDPGPGNLALSIILLIVIILFEMFIYLFKEALIALPGSRSEQLTSHHKKSVRIIMRNKDDVSMAESFASITLTLLFSFIACDAFGIRLARVFTGTYGMSGGLTTFLCALILCLASAFLLMTLAGIVPRRIGRKRPAGVIVRFSIPTLVLYRINVPAVKICNGISFLFLKLTGLNRLQEEKSVTEAEILSVVDAGGEAGAIEDEQREMINNIFEFDDVDVSDLMTHRTDITAIRSDAPIDGLRDLSVEEGYSRIPVYKDKIDDIVGIAYIKDILCYVDGPVPAGVTVSDIMREALYVPESMPCDKLFKDMNEKHIQMAVAVDEYGGTAGIITLEDLLESIVGSIQDEYDDEEEEIREVGKNIFTMDGTTDIEEVGERLHIRFPEGDYDTIGGFVISRLDYIPKDGTKAEVEFGGYRFTASDIEDRRIGSICAERMPDAPEETTEEDAIV